MVVRFLIVAEGDADHASARIFDGPDGRQDVRQSFLGRLTGNGAEDVGAFGTGELNIVAFVVDHESGGNALHDGVLRLGDGEGEVAMAMVT